MEIFVDEAGQFTKTAGWSIVCSLSIPHNETGPARRKVAYLTRDWPRAPSGELKGGTLDVQHLKALVDLLFERDAILYICAIDMTMETEEGLKNHKQRQCEGMTEHLTSAHHPNLVDAVWKLRRMLEAMPMQLYVQSVLMSDLVAATLGSRDEVSPG